MKAAPGETLELEVERPAAGGRMIARHGDSIVLVAGAIPGERVRARVERVQRGVVFARVVDVPSPSPDRIVPGPGLACGGNVLAHIAPTRQAQIKGEIVVDAFRRQARIASGRVEVVSGPADGYRVRARAHVRAGRWGFFEDGSHTPCSIAGSRQLAGESAALLESACAAVSVAAPGADAEVDWVESLDGRMRVIHAHLVSGRWAGAIAPIEGVSGGSISDTRRAATTQAWGTPCVVDTITGAAGPVPVRHHVRAFFQGNRYLLPDLVGEVIGRVQGGAIADLYAGVGLFSAAVARPGCVVDAVEGDACAAADLAVNAARAGGVRAVQRAVERFVRQADLRGYDAVIVDPPRAGLAPDVIAALAGAGVPSIVYVSCDPVTLARDVRGFLTAGYDLGTVRGFDLFPRTAHVETVVSLTRRR